MSTITQSENGWTKVGSNEEWNLWRHENGAEICLRLRHSPYGLIDHEMARRWRRRLGKVGYLAVDSGTCFFGYIPRDEASQPQPFPEEKCALCDSDCGEKVIRRGTLRSCSSCFVKVDCLDFIRRAHAKGSRNAASGSLDSVIEEQREVNAATQPKRSDLVAAGKLADPYTARDTPAERMAYELQSNSDVLEGRRARLIAALAAEQTDMAKKFQPRFPAESRSCRVYERNRR